MARHKTKQILWSTPDKSCGKNKYSSKREAEIIAEQQEIIFASRGLKLKVYHCMLCGGWHLTKHVGD